MMENITRMEIIEGIEAGLITDYLGTFEVGGETRAFYKTRKGAANEPTGFKIVYFVV